jgi:tetratricopeptide (TPR) repeat protein
MSTLSALLPSRASNRRPLLLLIVATLFVGAAILVRVVRVRIMPQPVQPPAAVELSSRQAIGQLQERLRRNPQDAASYALLGQALLQQVRETGDVTLYTRAGQAFDQALQLDPQQLDALIGQGILALALHDFDGALGWADQAWAINAFRAQTLGIKVDALVELGRYPEAVTTLQQMVDLRPDLSSYTRIAYLRELHGDVDGALEAMTQAATMGMPGTEQWLWTTVQLGHLYWNSGQLDQAERVYRQALAFQDDYAYALAGLARVQAAQGDLGAAIAQYETLAKRLPLPEFVVTLGELYQAAGQPAAGRQQYDLVRTMQTLNAASGMNVDLELATFDAIHGADPAAALAAAQAAYAQRPTIYAADTLAWAYYRTGAFVQAQQYSAEALRLGTRDALLHFHAGMIAAAQSDVRRAREHLATALAINPHFSPLWASKAETTLQQLAATR